MTATAMRVKSPILFMFILVDNLIQTAAIFVTTANRLSRCSMALAFVLRVRMKFASSVKRIQSSFSCRRHYYRKDDLHPTWRLLTRLISLIEERRVKGCVYAGGLIGRTEAIGAYGRSSPKYNTWLLHGIDSPYTGSLENRPAMMRIPNNTLTRLESRSYVNKATFGVSVDKARV